MGEGVYVPGDGVLEHRGTVFWIQGDGVLNPGVRCFGFN